MNNDAIEKRVDSLVDFILSNLGLENVSEEGQASTHGQVLKDLTNLLLEVSKVLIISSEVTNVAVQRRNVMDFKAIIGAPVNSWGMKDVELLVKLNDAKWEEFTKIMGEVAKSVVQETEQRSYFSDILEEKDHHDVLTDVEDQFKEVEHVLNTDVNKFASNLDEYVAHTEKVVDMFGVKNHDLRVTLNNALHKLTKVRLSFAQMDIIGTGSTDERHLRRDIVKGAKRVAKQHGYTDSSQIIRESKGF